MLPRFIVLEGIDGSGKSTVGSLLARRLDYEFMELNQGEVLSLLRQLRPHFGQDALHLLNLSSLKHTSSRIQDLMNTTGVVCARYSGTVEVYNDEINAHFGNPNVIRPNLQDIQLIQPDAVVYLDVEEDRRQARLKDRKELRSGDLLMQNLGLCERIKEGLRRKADFEIDTTFLTPYEVAVGIELCLAQRSVPRKRIGGLHAV